MLLLLATHSAAVVVNGMTTKFKRFIAIILCVMATIAGFLPVSADKTSSEDLVVIKKALFEKIEYDPLWLDVNNDGKFNIIDLVRMKKYLMGLQNEIVPIKYIDITFVDGSDTVVQRQYHSKCVLPELSANYLYWRVGNQYYSEKNVVTLKENTVFTAVESKKDVDFPIIDF